ncbi:hypothetical protein BASA83_011178 [Batrachochytrium salamandrivorans]|nr:hypothetical protein BASA83_011178 [Batrachochytrium salamandrivorans]
MSDHIAQVQNVLRVLQDNGLYCKAEKCHFYKSEIKYSATLSLLMDFEWILQNLGCSELADTKESPGLAKKSLQDLKTAFANRISSLIPMIPRLSWRPMHRIMHIRCTQPVRRLQHSRPIAFYARQMNSAEQNYEIYDKELLAVVESFKHWRHFLQGGLHPVTVLCDHKNLEYFMTTKKLTRRQLVGLGIVRVRLFAYSSTWQT